MLFIGVVLLFRIPFLEVDWFIALVLVIVGSPLLYFSTRCIHRINIGEFQKPQKKETKREGSRLDNPFVRALYVLGYNGWFPSRFRKALIRHESKFLNDKMESVKRKLAERRKSIDKALVEITQKTQNKKKG